LPLESHCWCNLYKETSFYHGATAPSVPRPPHCRGFTITDTLQSVGLLWTSDQPEEETSTRQHTTLTTDTHPCLWPRKKWRNFGRAESRTS